MTDKFCTHCYQRKPLNEFTRCSKTSSGRTSWCRSCRHRDRVSYAHKQYQRDPETIRERARRYRRARRSKVLELYGNRCSCCQESRKSFLCVDHVFGGGTKERQTVRSGGLYAKLLRAGRPLPQYRLLCSNCNCSRAILGVCEHELEGRSRLNDASGQPKEPNAIDTPENREPVPQMSPEITSSPEDRQ